MKRSIKIPVVMVAVLQAIVWTPYLLDPPWSLPTPMVVGERWIVWFGSHFDLGTATDFIPALVMVIAAVVALISAFRSQTTAAALRWLIWTNAAAILVLIIMEVIGTAAGVVQWNDFGIWFLVTILIWFAPPTSLIILSTRTPEWKHRTHNKALHSIAGGRADASPSSP